MVACLLVTPRSVVVVISAVVVSALELQPRQVVVASLLCAAPGLGLVFPVMG